MNRKKAMLALALLVPAPSLGTLAGMVWFPDTLLGKAVFAASKLWLFVFPAVWLVLVERGRPGLSPVRRGGWLAGLTSGLVFGLVIFLVYTILGRDLLDRAFFTERMRAIGLGAWPVFLAGAAYWILINSVLEEYVWRWFVYRKCEEVAGPTPAILLSALFFTLHHVLALRSYCSPLVTAVGSLGVFTAGAAWSLLYRRYSSIWPGYLSHALADVAVFGIGAALLFGSR